MAWRRTLIIGVVLAALTPATVGARDNGQFANSSLKSWFNNLASAKGLCCSFADGKSIADVDWDTVPVAGADGDVAVRYRVRIDGQWIVVPPEALITEPNRYGPAVAWPYNDSTGAILIRCFLPGAQG
jgi:hypothetical protein